MEPKKPRRGRPRGSKHHVLEPHELKFCTNCLTKKPASDFVVANKRSDGRNCHCKECEKARARERRTVAAQYKELYPQLMTILRDALGDTQKSVEAITTLHNILERHKP